MPVDKWESHPSYQYGLKVVSSLRTVNDVAERGVKTIQSFNRSITKKEESYQNLLLNVQAHRKKFPNANKATLLKEFKK